MPLPSPNPNEDKEKFLERCMGNPTMNEEYPDNKQRYAVCNSLWKEKKNMGEVVESDEKKQQHDNFGIERRFSPTAEIRLLEGEDENKLVGLGIVYNQWSDDLGGFKEIIAPGAGMKSAMNDDIFSTYNHDDNYVLGRVSAGTMVLSVDNQGIRYNVDLPETSFANDLKVSIGRGDVRGSSFRFRVTEDEWGRIDGQEIRKIVDFKLFEVGPVTNPAYPQTTTGIRSALNGLDIDFEALNRALLRAQTGNLEQRDIDIITQLIESLGKYLPTQERVDPPVVADDDSTLERWYRLAMRMLSD